MAADKTETLERNQSAPSGLQAFKRQIPSRGKILEQEEREGPERTMAMSLCSLLPLFPPVQKWRCTRGDAESSLAGLMPRWIMHGE
jgi:hypothetical protein